MNHAPVRRTLKRALPPPGPRRMPLGVSRGITMHVDFASQTRAFLGLYELELGRHLRRLCPLGSRAFDVGGQFGYDALVLAKLGGAAVASFEADAGCVATMRENFALNPLLGSLITPVTAWVGNGDDGTLALDDFAHSPQGFVPDVIKIDVDTEHSADMAEGRVLEGASELLAQRRPSLLVEVHSLELEQRCGALLVAHGYRPTIVSQRRVLRDHRPIAHNRWLVAEGRAR
jgi:hypothetical protein